MENSTRIASEGQIRVIERDPEQAIRFSSPAFGGVTDDAKGQFVIMGFRVVSQSKVCAEPQIVQGW